MEKILFLDFGNSLIKAKYKSKIYKFKYDSDIELKEFLINYKIDTIYFVDTKLENNFSIKEICQLLKIKLIEIKTKDVLKYLELNPKLSNNQLGVDLALMWFYIDKKDMHDALLVSYGTWTTFLNIQDKKLLGVGVLPGLKANHELMFNYHKDQSLMNQKGSSNQYIFGYGNYLMLEGLISLSVANQQLLIVTGGHATEIYKRIEHTNYLLLKELTLLGLELFVNFEKNLNAK